MSTRLQAFVLIVTVLLLSLIGSILNVAGSLEPIVRAEGGSASEIAASFTLTPHSVSSVNYSGTPSPNMMGQASIDAVTDSSVVEVSAVNEVYLSEATRIITGRDSDYTDSFGNLWWGDRYYSDGDTIRRTGITILTSDPEIYRRERWGTPHYAIPVVNGDYKVRLHFAETNPSGAAGWRIFDASIEGQQVINNLDLYAAAGGRNKILIKEFDVTVTDKELNIDFGIETENPEINGIEVLPKFPGGTTRRINTGQPATTTDRYGNPWQIDQFFDGGFTAGRGNIDIAVEDQEIYLTERWDMDSYAIPLPDGDYRIRLHFSETNDNSHVGFRIFDVKIEGATVIDNLDLYQETGGLNIIYIRIFDVKVTDGFLNIDFINVVENPQINGIEIFPLPSATLTPTPTNTGTTTPTGTPTATATPSVTPTATTTSGTKYSGKVYIPLMTNIWLNYFNSLKEIEPNNTAAQANGPLKSGTTYEGRFCSPTNCANDLAKGTTADTIDYYKFYVWAPQTVVNINLNNIPTGQDYDLYLRDATGTNNLQISNKNGNQPEDIVINLNPGLYYILVFNPFAKPNSSYYQLKVSY